ncbi:MAG: DUF3592 domain-containing protein [Anaerobutyricum sp.]
MSDSIEREQGSYLLAIIILMIVGFALMIADVKTYQRYHDCTQTVMAKIINVKVSSDYYLERYLNQATAKVRYEYIVDSQKYQSTIDGNNKVNDVGKNERILYNPEKPYKIVVAKKLVSLIACSMIVVFMFMFFIFQIIKKQVVDER